MANFDKKKISQNELRRIMSEQKNKFMANGRKIDSPLAKYKEDGTLTCIVCESVVRSDAVWTVHINSKQHKDNIARKKQQLLPPAPPAPKPVYKRPAAPSTTALVPHKKLKGILKNAPTPKLPEGFFESDIRSCPVPIVPAPSQPFTLETPSHNDGSSFLPTASRSDNPAGEEVMDTEEADVAAESKDPLPEGFFDDPVLDAKARNVEYKDPIQEEWDRFQKEIKEEQTVSTQIIEDDQEEATAERQIQEIDEQLRNWSRVLDLEKKKETVHSVAAKSPNGIKNDEQSEEEEEFDEFLDWRAKKSFK